MKIKLPDDRVTQIVIYPRDWRPIEKMESLFPCPDLIDGKAGAGKVNQTHSSASQDKSHQGKRFRRISSLSKREGYPSRPASADSNITPNSSDEVVTDFKGRVYPFEWLKQLDADASSITDPVERRRAQLRHLRALRSTLRMYLH